MTENSTDVMNATTTNNEVKATTERQSQPKFNFSDISKQAREQQTQGFSSIENLEAYITKLAPFGGRDGKEREQLVAQGLDKQNVYTEEELHAKQIFAPKGVEVGILPSPDPQKRWTKLYTPEVLDKENPKGIEAKMAKGTALDFDYKVADTMEAFKTYEKTQHLTNSIENATQQTRNENDSLDPISKAVAHRAGLYMAKRQIGLLENQDGAKPFTVLNPNSTQDQSLDKNVFDPSRLTPQEQKSFMKSAAFVANKYSKGTAEVLAKPKEQAVENKPQSQSQGDVAVKAQGPEIIPVPDALTPASPKM